MKNAFCTISTHSHLYKSFALAKSLSQQDARLMVLIVDRESVTEVIPENVDLFYLRDLQGALASAIQEKYKHKTDCLRWSLKPIFLSFLLQAHPKMIYIDNDIYFFANPDFLFKELSTAPIVLTPHHYPRDPTKNQNWFEANFRVGLYNAGFIGVNQDASLVLDWWAKSCLYRCEKNYWRGLFDDQKYLDLVPIIEPKTKVLTHLGCNVAEWNAEICVKKELNGSVVINDTIPLIFYHFNGYSLQNLSPDSYLLKTYISALREYKSNLRQENLIPGKSKLDAIKLFVWKYLNKRNG